jgi:putative phage-type endonuclease
MSDPAHRVTLLKERDYMKEHAPQDFNGAKLLGVFTAGTSEWHEARSYSLGGSEIGTIMGLNPWESAYALWAKKTGKIEDPPLTNWAVRFGQAFEEPILKLWCEEHPEYEVFTTGTYQDCDNPYLHANPDALARNRKTGEWVVVEVKTARTSFEALPPNYECQVRHYMMILKIQRAVVVAVAGMTWQEFWVERDEFTEQVQLDQAKKFIEHMANDTKPDFDGSESTYETVRKLHPEIDDVEVEIDGLHYLAKAQEEFDTSEAKLRLAKSEVLNAMGRAKHAFIESEGQRYRVASRQARGDGVPYLVVNRKK